MLHAWTVLEQNFAGKNLFFCYLLFSTDFAGRVAAEGKVEHKFDLKPHNENMEEYRKMCRERTNKSMVKNRQIQVWRDLYYLQNILLGFCIIGMIFIFFLFYPNLGSYICR